MRQDTGKGQVEAIGPCRELGYAEAGPLGKIDADLARVLIFFERDL